MLYRLSGILILGFLSLQAFGLPADSTQIWAGRSLGEGVNSSSEESHPVASANGELLFFARTAHPQNIGMDDKADIWVATRKEDGSWGRAINLGRPINDSGHNYPVGVTNNGQSLFILNIETEGKNTLYRSDLNGRLWSKPKKLSINGIQDFGEILHFQVGLDGQSALLIAENPSGGDTDIFHIRKIGKQSWSRPAPLSEVINSSSDESRAFLAADGKTIFFKRGVGGSGQWFFSRRSAEAKDGQSWTSPLALDAFFPGLAAEYVNLSLDGQLLFFEEEQGPNNADLYYLELPEVLRPRSMFAVSGYILDADTGLPLNVDLNVKTLKDQQAAEEPLKFYGKYQLILDPDHPFYIIPNTSGYMALGNYVLDLSQESPSEGVDTDLPITKLVLPKNADSTLLQLANYNQQLAQLSRNQSEEGETDTLNILPAAISDATHSLQGRGNAYDREYQALQKKYFKLLEQEEHIDEQEAQGQESEERLQSMKDRYNEYLRTPAEKNPGPGLSEENADELRRMKARFRKYKAQQKGEKLADVPSVPAEGAESEKSPADGFEKLKKEVREELIRSQQPVLFYQLQEEVFPAVKEELSRSMPEELQQSISQERWEEMEDNVRSIFSSQIRSAYDRGQAGQEYSSSATSEEWDLLKTELQRLMTREIREEMKTALLPVIREELKAQLEKELRKEIEEQLTTEITQLLYKEAVDETGLPLFTTESTEILGKAGFASMKAGNFYRQDLELTPVRVGMTLPMELVHFEVNQARLKPYALEQLDQIVILLHDYPELVVEVEGHTNALCSRVYGAVLSELRAQIVANYLVENGIDGSRVSYKGYGGTKPLVSGNTKEAHRKNQRVELRVTGVSSATMKNGYGKN